VNPKLSRAGVHVETPYGLVVFAATLLPGKRDPDLINDDEALLESSFVVPTECLGGVGLKVRASGPA
jgi:hypothetical protein